MEITTAILLGFTLMVGISIFAAFVFGRKLDNIKDFYYGGNDIKVSFVVTLLLSTSFSMNGVIYQTYLGYAYGWSAILVQAVWCASFLWLSRHSERVISFEGNGTIHGTIAKVFNSRTAKIAAAATVIGFTLQIGWELLAGSKAIATIAPESGTLLVIILFGLAIVSAIYTLLGGLKANMVVNVVQNLIAGAAFVVIPFIFIGITQDVSVANFAKFDAASLFGNTFNLRAAFLSNILFSLVWQFVDMSTWQNIIAGQNDANSAKSALRRSAFWILIFPGLIGTILGIAISNANTGINDPGQFVPFVLEKIASIHWSLVVVFVMGCVAAMLSTLDGLMLAVGQVVSWDWIHPAIIKNKLNQLFRNHSKEDITDTDQSTDKKVILTTRISIFAVALLGAVTAYLIVEVSGFDIFEIVYIVTVAQLALVPVVFKILWSKPGTRFKNGSFSVGVSLFLGVLGVVYLVFLTNDLAAKEYLYVLPILTLGISSVLAIFIREDSEALDLENKVDRPLPGSEDAGQ